MQDFIDESVFDRFCPDTIQGDFMKHSKKGSRGPRLYFSHFQNRILCAFLLCTLIPIFIIGGISYAVSYNIAKDKILNASISADAQLHTQFDNRLQQVENIADTLQYNMYNLMQADAPMDTLAMLSEIRSNLYMFKTSFDLAYINIFLPDEHMASSESLYFFPVSKLSDFQIPKEVLENPGTSSVWFYQDLLSVPFLVNNSYHITNSVSCCRVLKHPGTDSIKYAYIIYLDASEFSSILQEIFHDNQITSYILTDNGKIVASNNPSLLSASLDEEKLDFLYNKGDSLKKRAHTNYHTTTLRNGWLQVICKFTLQPFLENSIMHGLSQKTPEVHISIDLSYGDDTVIIVITDNGIGMAKEQLLELQKTLDEKIVNYEKHFGIGNVNKRISNPYFGNGRISVESCLYEGTSITIEFDQMEKYDEECNDCR